MPLPRLPNYIPYYIRVANAFSVPEEEEEKNPSLTQQLTNIGRIPSLNEEIQQNVLNNYNYMNNDSESSLLVESLLVSHYEEISKVNAELAQFIQQFQQAHINTAKFHRVEIEHGEGKSNEQEYVLTSLIAAHTSAQQKENNPSLSPAVAKKLFKDREKVLPVIKGISHDGRCILSVESCNILREWFLANILSPYPTEVQKEVLAAQAQIQLRQVNNWFTNTRKRFWREYIAQIEKEIKEQTNPSSS
jgi:hypothetical protein